MANLVMTTKGLIERERLTMAESFGDSDTECWHAIEYYLDGELVKRGCHTHLKQGLNLKAEVNRG
jgi:hypothetical protein